MSDRDKRFKRYNKECNHAYYYENREIILFKKKHYAKVNKERIASYHARYYLEHKVDINRKHRQWYRIKKDEARMQVS
jgi:hypothetical protein